MSSILIRNIRTIYGVEPTLEFFKKGMEMRSLVTLSRAFILIENESIYQIGSMDDCPDRADKIIDASGCLVFPTWCDSHTHIVYAASRENEYVQRLKGLSYEQIAKNGGGILNSAHKLHQTSEEELFNQALIRLREVIQTGTGAIEIKSGYGLTTEDELKMLRVIRRLKEVSPIPIKSNFLGAHAIPLIYKDNRKKYIDLITNTMLPMVAAEGLADYCDVFCDDGFFTIDETDTILKAAASYGLKAKIHANELANSGGVQVGIKNNAVSVDHLECIGDEEIAALKASQTIPTVLPSCSFFLHIDYAPARKMIDNGLGIAIASDYNPGSSPSGNVPLLMAIACNNMRLLPEEVFNAITINGAFAMEVQHKYGSLYHQKNANLIITKEIPSLDYFIYAFGTDHIKHVIINGKIKR
jgi:imidazolonepropionase